jgi:hypothetical protein
MTSIPAVAETIANLFDLYVNTNIDKFINDFDAHVVSLSVDVNSQNIRDLFTSDQFLSSFLTQDPRYMFNDAFAPLVPVVAITDSSLDIGLNINFGRILAIMCHNGDPSNADPYENIFQTIGEIPSKGVRSLYSVDSTHIDGSSYHKGTIINDINPLNADPSSIDYAINNYSLQASVTLGEYSYQVNLVHNFNTIAGVVNAHLYDLNTGNYVKFSSPGSE